MKKKKKHNSSHEKCICNFPVTISVFTAQKASRAPERGGGGEILWDWRLRAATSFCIRPPFITALTSHPFTTTRLFIIFEKRRARLPQVASQLFQTTRRNRRKVRRWGNADKRKKMNAAATFTASRLERSRGQLLSYMTNDTIILPHS